MTESFSIDSLESNRIEVTFNTIPIYSCIVNREVAFELILRKPCQIRHLIWRRNNENVFAYITRDNQICIVRHFYTVLYDLPKKLKI
jgi:hypothetical protein